VLQGGAVYVSPSEFISTVSLTTFAACRVSGQSASGGSCYLATKGSEVSHCCFFSSFSSGDGQAIYFAFKYQETPGWACDSVTFHSCGTNGATFGTCGCVTMDAPGTDRIPSFH
jgi:hypothetical protein